MGLLLSKFQEEPEDVLDRLEANIRQIECDIRRLRRTYMRSTKYFRVFYIISCITYFIVYCTSLADLPWTKILLYALLLIVIIVLYIPIKIAAYEYYVWEMKQKEMKLKEIKEQKKKKLEEVKNTAVYSLAKNILDKYDGPEEELAPLMHSEYTIE